jgi:4-alpha-glucanotransferase
LCGIAPQLYSLRRKNEFGYGDFTALTQFVASAAKHGSAAVAMSPVHAMFGANPSSFSPYSPSNRMFLNSLFADASMIGAEVRRSTLIDWPRAARIHRRLFEASFKHFTDGKALGAADFEEFRSRGGTRLFDHACFEALDESRIAAEKPSVSSARVRAFADEHRQRIVFHQFLQWRASTGLSSAQATARTHGMPIGLIADLAVGVDPNGSECWSQPHDMLIGATVGAPPDALNAVGQNWGLTTFSPGALERNGFAPFLAILRAAMRHAGGVRLDHVMSLMRLWLVPDGARAVDGAYLRYPFGDLVRLVALESWRHRCIVIGEDLGTVPDDCRSRLSRAGILGLDVLPFMRDGKKFIPPARWRDTAVAMTSTHDIAPVAAWWAARDLDWRRKLELFGDLDEKTERRERDVAKAELARLAHVSARATPDGIVDAAIQVTARSPSPLVIIPVEDLVAASEQPNLPGTIAEHPNWRRRYRDDASRLLDSRRVAARLKRLARARKRAT